MEMGGQPGSDVHKLPDALDSRGLVKVTSGNRFPVTKDESPEKLRNQEAAYLMTSKSVPAEVSSIFWNFMMSSSCMRTSRPLRKSLGCKK